MGWVRFDSALLGSDNQFIFCRSDNAASSAAQIDWALANLSTDSKIRFRVNVGTTSYDAIGGSAASADTWYFVYAYYDELNNEIGISIDDGTVVTTAVTGKINIGGDQLKFGRNSSVASIDFYFDGKADEWGWWTRTLSASEVSELYNSGAGLAYSDL